MCMFLILIILGYTSCSEGVILEPERAEVLFVNESIMKDFIFTFGKLNRTTFALNTSFILLRDFTDGKIMLTISGDQFYHNEYRFTGQRYTVNSCYIWKLNVIKLVDQLKNLGFNADPCDFKKGPYNITNYIMDSKLYPKYLPLGRWRISIRCFHEDVGEIIFLHWYMEVKADNIN